MDDIETEHRKRERLVWIVAGTAAILATACRVGMALANEPRDYQLKSWFALGFSSYAAVAILSIGLGILRLVCRKLAESETWYHARAPLRADPRIRDRCCRSYDGHGKHELWSTAARRRRMVRANIQQLV